MNDQIDRYTLERLIGRGGMAEVFLASAEGPHGFRKRVAIKRILPSHHGGSRDFEERFIREARIVADLDHANIVQVLDFGRADEALFIVMEYVEGCELTTVIKEGREPMPIIAAMQIAIELCKGLDFAHSKNIVHRDISPSNILISKQGAVKIADFGIAQATDSHKTQTGTVMGKWRYMSPEQSMGSPLDHRSDIFAAGVVLFEIFTGRQLFDGKNADEIVKQIHNIQLGSLSKYRPDAPKDLDKILARCLSRIASDRYSRANEIAADLRTLCLDERWLPSSDDVAALVESQSGSDKTHPHRMIAFDPTLEGDFGSRATDSGSGLINAEAREGTLLLHKTTTNSGVPIWQSELRDVPRENVPPSANAIAAPAAPRKRRTLFAALGTVAAVALGITLALRASHSDPPAKRDAGASSLLASSESVSSVSAALPADARPVAAIADAAQDEAVANAAQDEAVADASAAPATPKKQGVSRAEAKLQVKETRQKTQKVHYGTIALWVDPWADIYFKGKKIGRAPKRALRLPHGKHVLRLVNPSLGVEKRVRVKVPADSPYRFDLTK